MNEATWTYLGQLARALQIEGVEGSRAGDFVAEIDSHLAESGADPVEEFGTPHRLATELARRPRARRPGWVPPMWTTWLLGIVVAVVGVVAIDAVMLGTLGGQIPIRLRGVSWIVIILGTSLGFSYYSARQLDGRTWSAVTGGAAALAVLVIAIAATTASQLAGERIIAHVPVAAFWIVAGIGVPSLLAVIRWRSNPIRFPEHASHLRRLKWAPFLGRPAVRR